MKDCNESTAQANVDIQAIKTSTAPAEIAAAFTKMAQTRA